MGLGERGVICGSGREEGGDMWDLEEGGDMWDWEGGRGGDMWDWEGGGGVICGSGRRGVICGSGRRGGDMWDWEEGRVHNDIPYSLNYQMVGIGLKWHRIFYFFCFECSS